MTEPRTPEQPAREQPEAEQPLDPPPPGSDWVRYHEPPADEAEREVQATVRSVSRLEESN